MLADIQARQLMEIGKALQGRTFQNIYLFGDGNAVPSAIKQDPQGKLCWGLVRDLGERHLYRVSPNGVRYAGNCDKSSPAGYGFLSLEQAVEQYHII